MTKPCAVALVLFGVACSGDAGDGGGPAVYSERHSDGNTFACATCHAMEEPGDGLIRPGHPIGDAAARPHYKNGQLGSLLEAVNTCRREWMAAPAFAADDPRWLELEALLVARAPASAPALTFTRVDPPANLAGGDAARGRAVWSRRCVVCHGEDGLGSERAPRVTGLGLDGEYIAERVRRSGAEDSDVYPGLSGGRMPFWSAERLSDAELIDVVAYVRDSEDTGGGADAGPGAPDAAPSECGASHPRVGHVAELTTRFHGVSGTATVVDDCTVRIDMFDYDGEGVDVRVYGAEDGAYEDGFAMSGDLRRAGGYADATITATLPAGRTLDELDGVSIWCVPVGASFGDGLFGPP